MSMPVVSVVIPTLNRSHLLRASLKSALEQTYTNLEIVVFDDMSSDDTASVASATGSGRVRYVRSDVRLNMSDSFEAALNCATGEYITFLTDDSYLLPGAIALAVAAVREQAVPLVAWRHAGYFDEHWVESARRNALYIPDVTHRSVLLDSKRSLRQWFETIQGRSEWMPRSINSLCKRSVITSATLAQGRFFLAPAPDHSSGVGMLMNCSSYVAIDEPLVIDGVTKESIGPAQSFTRGKSADDFYRSLGPTLEDATYLGMPTTSAIIARSFERTAAAYADAPRLSPRIVLMRINDDLAKLDTYGTDVTALYEVLDRKALDLGRSFVASIRLARLRSRAKWTAVKLSRTTSGLPRLERLRGLRTVRGREAGFEDIEGAARELLRRSRLARHQ